MAKEQASIIFARGIEAFSRFQTMVGTIEPELNVLGSIHQGILPIKQYSRQ